MAIATLATLKAAELAYQRLMTGSGIAKFHDQNGEEVTYASQNANNLLKYIYMLRAQLGLPSSGVTGGLGLSPMRPWFV